MDGYEGQAPKHHHGFHGVRRALERGYTTLLDPLVHWMGYKGDVGPESLCGTHVSHTFEIRSARVVDPRVRSLRLVPRLFACHDVGVDHGNRWRIIRPVCRQ